MKGDQRPLKTVSRKMRRSCHTAMLVILCITFVGTWPHTTQAELDDGQLPLTDDQGASEIKEIVKNAKRMASLFSNVSSGIGAATMILEWLDLLDSGIDMRAELDALHEHLNALGVALSWYEALSSRDDWLAKSLGAVELVGQLAQTNMLPLDRDAPDATNSRNAAIRATLPSWFLRVVTDRASDGATDGEIGWKGLIPNRSEVKDLMGQLVVYDWRLGIPSLMQLIALRLPVIAAINPDFRNDREFSHELLTHYRKALIENYKRMIADIHCGGRYRNVRGSGFISGNYACADINTGLAASHGFSFTSHAASERMKRLKAELTGEVLRRMPLFEMQEMIGMLSLYANPGLKDLTEKSQGIAVNAAPNLCLDVQWGNPAPGTPVWLWECNGGDAQSWVYNRESSTIYNPVFRRCLEVQGGDAMPGTPVQLGDCNCSQEQQWTYDPETRVLQSRLGPVLDIRDGVMQPRTPVQVEWRHEGSAQQWVTDSLHNVEFQGLSCRPKRGRTPATHEQ